jgi:biotin operon repressor
MKKDKRKYGRSQTFYNKSRAFIPPELLASEAYLTIKSAKTIIVLVRFWQKAWQENKSQKKKDIKKLVITNNGEIFFTYAEAAELGISDTTFWKAIKELIARGFIDIAEEGNWYGKKPNLFSLSRRFLNYGSPDFQVVEWERRLPDGLGFQKKKTKLALVPESQKALVPESQRPIKAEAPALENKSQKNKRAACANH